MQFEQAYSYRIAYRERRRAPRFVVGLLTAVALSAPMGLLIAWSIKELFF